MLLGGLAEIQENTEDLFDHVLILCYIVTLFTLSTILHVASFFNLARSLLRVKRVFRPPRSCQSWSWRTALIP